METDQSPVTSDNDMMTKTVTREVIESAGQVNHRGGIHCLGNAHGYGDGHSQHQYRTIGTNRGDYQDFSHGG